MSVRRNASAASHVFGAACAAVGRPAARSASLAAAPRGGAAMEPPGVGLGAAAGPLAGFGLGTFGGKEPPQDFLPKQAERMMKNKSLLRLVWMGNQPTVQ